MSIRNTTDPLPTLAGPQDSLPNSKLERGEDCALESRRQWSIGQRQMKGNDEEEMGLFWKLPEAKSVHLGKLGPGFGVGAGCGFGFAVGLIGGTGVGPGIPGLQLGFGFGAGCGVGLGFGYGLGRGIGYDGNRRYSNVGNNYQNRGNVPLQDEIGALVDELVVNTKKLIQATSREVDKWRRY